jgi:hypothetical protein
LPTASAATAPGAATHAMAPAHIATRSERGQAKHLAGTFPSMRGRLGKSLYPRSRHAKRAAKRAWPGVSRPPREPPVERPRRRFVGAAARARSAGSLPTQACYRPPPRSGPQTRARSAERGKAGRVQHLPLIAAPGFEPGTSPARITRAQSQSPRKGCKSLGSNLTGETRNSVDSGRSWPISAPRSFAASTR